MKNKVCLITGANSGIGKVTAFKLAEMGATVIMVCRNQAKGETAMAEIIEKSGNNSIDLMLADISSQKSIRKLSEIFSKKYQRLNVLINNAGGIFGQHQFTEDGVEWTFAVNHLAYFLLTNLLVDMLKLSAPARIVNVASEGHRAATIDFNNLQGEKKYGAMNAYFQSKLANVLFTYELDRRLSGTGVTANCLHPGLVASNFGNSGSKFFRFLVQVAKPFFISSEKGAETSVYLASSAEIEGVSGKYFVRKKEVKSSPESYNKSSARKLWTASAELTHWN